MWLGLQPAIVSGELRKQIFHSGSIFHHAERDEYIVLLTLRREVCFYLLVDLIPLLASTRSDFANAIISPVLFRAVAATVRSDLRATFRGENKTKARRILWQKRHRANRQVR